MLAVLSYHGWEIDPGRLAEDVRALRERGWRDASLDEVESLLRRGMFRSGRFFHVTIDDGASGDRDCVAALRAVSCPATLFLSLDAMSDADRAVHCDLRSASDLRIEDHSLRHQRTFHYRHVIGFHSEAAPLMSSPDPGGLPMGSPVCTYGGELVRPRFIPDERAVAVCREAARAVTAPPGNPAWQAALREALLASGHGFRRFGRLCIAGEYESPQVFRRRIRDYLAEGRRRLEAFTGRAPVAFAHPWWQPSPPADRYLRELGYRLTFAGRGLCRHPRTRAIPRLFVNNETRRPIDPERLGAADTPSPLLARLGAVGRRALFH